MQSYQDFLSSKRFVVPSSGVRIDEAELHPQLFPFQKALVRWALAKGKAALFCDTGLGKTLMQLVWAQHAGERVLILAPLGVARQTVREGQRWHIPVRYCRTQPEVASGISITNYEMLPHFDAAAFDAVVLDESSILKNFEGKTRSALIETFRATPMRLCCTATPAPNDISELANHAEFLGVMTRAEMLASFFVHDDQGWRLKGHARGPFYRWLASWGMSLKRPSDLGYSDLGYALPDLRIVPQLVQTDYTPAGQLFATTLKGVTDRMAVRRQTLEDRVQRAAELIAAEPDQAWIAWCGLNDEGRALAARFPHDAVLVEGRDSPETKADALEAFAMGRVRVLVSKASIAGFGLNFQHCARQVFVGLGDSYETYYQAIRRSYRFGQEREVHAHIVLTEPEEVIYTNVLRKEREAETTGTELLRHVAAFEREEIGRVEDHAVYDTDEGRGAGWRLLLGDAAERLAELEPASVDLSVFSPPFGSLYTYSGTERDLGNSRTETEFWEHFGYIIRDLLRLSKPGRLACVHVAQIPSQKARDGVIGLKDFRGGTILNFQQAGWIFHGEVCIDKDPQAQAIRTKSKGLLFTQMHKDSSWSRPALADYILVFRAPGDNRVPIKPDITNDEWIEWARPVWYGIRESNTLNVVEARSDDDERHICPLQLSTIERCLRLWSNAGETVLSPFAGIGSEGYEAILRGRRFIGVELKPEYWRVAVSNLRQAERVRHTPDLFSSLEMA